MTRGGLRALVALVAVLAILGHDALMVGDAHAAPTPAANHAAMRQHDAEHGGTTLETVGQPMAPNEPVGCTTIRLATLRVSGEGRLGPAGPPAAAVVAALDGAGPPSFTVVGTEPSRPPGVRRALLQVYRISADLLVPRTGAGACPCPGRAADAWPHGNVEEMITR